MPQPTWALLLTMSITLYPFQKDKAPFRKAQIISKYFLEHDSGFTVLKWPLEYGVKGDPHCGPTCPTKVYFVKWLVSVCNHLKTSKKQQSKKRKHPTLSFSQWLSHQWRWYWLFCAFCSHFLPTANKTTNKKQNKRWVNVFHGQLLSF